MSENTPRSPINIIVGVTGSVAAIKLDELVDRLVEKFGSQSVNICVVPTQNAVHFLSSDFNAKFNVSKESLSTRLEYLRTDEGQTKSKTFAFLDQDEWSSWTKRNGSSRFCLLRFNLIQILFFGEGGGSKPVINFTR